ncbi:MAG: antibiotic biosynthesis monooxygenase [Actinomyces sp.]|uniref:putative quinol monooxygenase n=1 Tax=Actinomyces sp. TaxID=29317 RepID=UPI0026DD725C|nr:antibiotic biosynthesis monooxygenase [Actinomyces sp.]MDO4243256.1 antibiotic biosynthesis monooxygenase [Actinomyces sp.]
MSGREVELGPGADWAGEPVSGGEAVDGAVAEAGDGARPGQVVLTGELRCADEEQAARVRRYLPRHIELSRAEPGCLSFEVTATGDPLLWRVEEAFVDEEAFARHQARVAASQWGRKTQGIERRYEIR